MYNHAPADYVCPFCHVAVGVEAEFVYTRQQDVVYRTAHATAFVAAAWWPNNPGHVLVIPNQHFENLYDLPADSAASIHMVAQQVALALKATYQCAGISTRQHNEPAGNQDVWHYHLHVFPRYPNDQLDELTSQRRLTAPTERIIYAQRLRQWLTSAVPSSAETG